jgi:hypothetical protein
MNDNDTPLRRDAMHELVWRFHSAEAAIGIRAQNMGDVKGAKVFDAAASHELHMSLRDEKHRWAVNRMRAIDSTLWALEPDQRAALKLAFAPGGRVEHRIATHFEVTFGFERASILGYVLHSRAMRVAWASHHESLVMPDQDQLLALLEKAPVETLKRLFRDALSELMPAVDAYVTLMLARKELERQDRERRRGERDKALQVALQATHERLWGKP